MTVTTPQYVEVEHVGGPYDGEFVRVQVDETGQPPAFYLLDDIGASNPSVDPSSGPMAGIATQFYDRDVVMGADGPRYVYRWTGESLSEAA